MKFEYIVCQNCNNSNKKIKIDEIHDINKYYLFCKYCLKDIKICSKTRSKSLFHLSEKDFRNVKQIYLENNIIYQFYKYSDIEQIVLNKYGSMDNLQNIINQKKETRTRKTEDVKIKREQLIQKELQYNKLEFKNYGDIYSYINYGKPELKKVIEGELTKIKQKNDRRKELANELNKLDIVLDESLKSCYEYMNNIGSKSLENTVKCIEMEHFLKYNTDYDKLCKKYDHKTAKDMAIKRYAEKQKLPKNITTNYDKTILKFE